MSGNLHYEVVVSPELPQTGRGPLPDGSQRMWSPISSTLITSGRNTVLVDPPMTSRQAESVGDRIAELGTHLDAIYVTHGHGDHWFGAIPLLERFPGTPVLATPGAIEMMAVQSSAEFRASFWDVIFPGQIPQGSVVATPVDAEGFDVDGHLLIPISVGHTDTDSTSMLHVPDIGLLVAGDAVYNGVHMYLTESGGAVGITEWLAALDIAEALEPSAVVAGHKNPSAADEPESIGDSRKYLSDALKLLETSSTAVQFYEGMLARHPNRINPGALWGGAATLYPADPRPGS